MRKALVWSLLIFGLLFPLAWLNSELYSTARDVAGMKSQIEEQRRQYYMVVAKFAAQDRLSVIQSRAFALGMTYPEGIRFEENQVAGGVSAAVGHDGGREADLASVVGRQ